MRLRQIEIFYAVYSAGSISKAAELLGVSQPAVSKVLRHTEDSLGFPLFERHSSGLNLHKKPLTCLRAPQRFFQKLVDFGAGLKQSARKWPPFKNSTSPQYRPFGRAGSDCRIHKSRQTGEY